MKHILARLLCVLLLLPTITAAGRTEMRMSTGTGNGAVRRKVAADLDARLAGLNGAEAWQNVPVIISPVSAAARKAVTGKVKSLGGSVRRTYKSFELISAELPLVRIRELEADASVNYIAPDRALRPAGLIETTTGTDQVRGVINGSTLDGSGIGIAVIDSGVYTAHSAFVRNKATNITVSRDFTGAGILSEDIYGHGSHVATLLGGSTDFAGGAYSGLAPGANLLNLRVLDDNGKGTADNVIAAIDWCIVNKITWNIRVINLSLGTLPVDSYRDDPLCLAVRRAHAAGIVVVCAAGNLGKDAAGHKIYGGIQSPGIDPSVLTVGASNTLGTAQRSDDVITTYSSRGPTRGFSVDGSGVRHYDNLMKPDLVAPGNRLIAAQSAGPVSGAVPNTLIQLYPDLDTGTSTVRTSRTMYLSGTSMSAPLVAGAAALILQTNPTLTPNLVKAILMYTAQPLAGFNTLEQGAGLLNVEGAIRVARLIKASPQLLTNGSPLLTSALPKSQMSLIADESCWWGQGVMASFCFLYGSRLMTYWQGMYAPGVLLADAVYVNSGGIKQTPGLVAGGVSNSQGAVLNNGIVMADGSLLVSGIVMADGISIASGIVMADGMVMADGIVMADGTSLPDGMINPSTTFRGDNTPAMQPVPIP